MRVFAFLCGLLSFATTATAEGYGFRTPSANIYCNGSVDGGNIQCVIVERSGPPAMRNTTGCDGYWGHHFALDRSGPARLTCGYQPRKSTYTDVAAYGVSAEFGGITCTSERTGLTCRNRGGNGFFLSRRQQSIF